MTEPKTSAPLPVALSDFPEAAHSYQRGRKVAARQTTLLYRARRFVHWKIIFRFRQWLGLKIFPYDPFEGDQ